MATQKKNTIAYTDQLIENGVLYTDNDYQAQEQKNRNRRRNRTRGQHIYQGSRLAAWQYEENELLVSR